MILAISVDDGHEQDLRILELLKKYNLTKFATFYIAPLNHQRPVMSLSQMKEVSKYCEIGGHTMKHFHLNTLSEVDQINEIMEGKNFLEGNLNIKITKFAYPRGYFAEETKRYVEMAGFTLGRTMKQGMITDPRVYADYKPFEVPITIHTHPNYINEWRDVLHKSVSSESGYFHITMHGWEIEKFNLWEEIEKIFRALSSLDIKMESL